MQAYVSVIKSIARYRVLQINNKYYIADLEENPHFFYLPFITWMHRYTLYELKKGQAQRISEYNQSKGGVGLEAFSSYYFLIVGIGLFIGKTVVSSGIAYIPFLNHTFIQWLFVLLTVIAVIYFRFVQHRKSYLKMQELVDLSSLNQKKVRFYPVNKMNYIFSLILWVFFLGFTILSLSMFFQLNILLGLVGFWVCLSYLASAFRLFIHPKYVYKCIFYE